MKTLVLGDTHGRSFWKLAINIENPDRVIFIGDYFDSFDIKGEEQMSDRMKNALQLADKCWKRANRSSPEFVEEYLTYAEKLLMSKPYIRGDEFRSFCHQHGLARPAKLHPNVWVSGVRALGIIGWMHPMQKVSPKC